MIASYRRAESRGEDFRIGIGDEPQLPGTIALEYRFGDRQIRPVLRHASRQRANRLLSRAVNRGRENLQPELYFLPICLRKLPDANLRVACGARFFVAPREFLEEFFAGT